MSCYTQEKNEFSHTSHIPRAQKPHVASGYHMEQSGYRIFTGSPNVLLNFLASWSAGFKTQIFPWKLCDFAQIGKPLWGSFLHLEKSLCSLLHLKACVLYIASHFHPREYNSWSKIYKTPSKFRLRFQIKGSC